MSRKSPSGKFSAQLPFIGRRQGRKIIFRGKGKGSGLGLSAWGARGMANADAKATYKTILAHYYPGIQLVR